MSLDITWTITAIIAVSSFLSPIAVAIINNRHQARLRKYELEHDRQIKQIDLNQQAIIHQADVYYADKKAVFMEFAKCAGAFSMDRSHTARYQALHSAIDNALLFCNSENQIMLIDFQILVDTELFGGSYTPDERADYSTRISKILMSLNKELESTKPVINSECGES